MTVLPFQRITGDPLLDMKLVDIRRSLEEAYRIAENAGFEEPTGFVCDTSHRIARRIAQDVFLPGVIEDAERVSNRIIACVPRSTLGYALDQVSREACLMLRDVPLDDPALWNVVLLDEACTVVTVDWRALLEADAQEVIARAHRARQKARRAR